MPTASRRRSQAAGGSSGSTWVTLRPSRRWLSRPPSVALPQKTEMPLDTRVHCSMVKASGAAGRRRCHRGQRWLGDAKPDARPPARWWPAWPRAALPAPCAPQPRAPQSSSSSRSRSMAGLDGTG